MSVHGEYARALRALCVRLAEYEAIRGGADWAARFESAIADESRDLSTAARAADALLDSLDRELEGVLEQPREGGLAGGHFELLHDACTNLRAHCRAILGVRSGVV